MYNYSPTTLRTRCVRWSFLFVFLTLCSRVISRSNSTSFSTHAWLPLALHHCCCCRCWDLSGNLTFLLSFRLLIRYVSLHSSPVSLVCAWHCLTVAYGWEYFKISSVCTGIFFKPEAEKKCISKNTHVRVNKAWMIQLNSLFVPGEVTATGRDILWFLHLSVKVIFGC